MKFFSMEDEQGGENKGLYEVDEDENDIQLKGKPLKFSDVLYGTESYSKGLITLGNEGFFSSLFKKKEKQDSSYTSAINNINKWIETNFKNNNPNKILVLNNKPIVLNNVLSRMMVKQDRIATNVQELISGWNSDLREYKKLLQGCVNEATASSKVIQQFKSNIEKLVSKYNDETPPYNELRKLIVSAMSAVKKAHPSNIEKSTHYFYGGKTNGIPDVLQSEYAKNITEQSFSCDPIDLQTVTQLYKLSQSIEQLHSECEKFNMDNGDDYKLDGVISQDDFPFSEYSEEINNDKEISIFLFTVSEEFSRSFSEDVWSMIEAVRLLSVSPLFLIRAAYS